MKTKKVPLSQAASVLAPRAPLQPNEHARLLVELLQPGGVELARRWVAALLRLPAQERAATVEELERRVGTSGDGLGATPRPRSSEPSRKRVLDAAKPGKAVEIHVVHPPMQREGYVEQIHASYRVPTSSSPHGAGSTRSKASRRA